MRHAGFLLRICLLGVIFVGMGIWSAQAILRHAERGGKPEYEVRLPSYMAGLFVGGSAATLVGVLMLLGAKRGGSE